MKIAKQCPVIFCGNNGKNARQLEMAVCLALVVSQLLPEKIDGFIPAIFI